MSFWVFLIFAAAIVLLDERMDGWMDRWMNGLVTSTSLTAVTAKNYQNTLVLE